jgi:hypothetical protein
VPTLRSAVALGAAFAVFLGSGATSRAWGFQAHRLITGHAIELMPPALKPFFRRHRAMVVEHSIDPDLWRNAGWVQEPPRHFLDLDAYGPPPFDALPRDYDQAAAKFGAEKVEENGSLPWRLAEMYGKLVGAFRDQAQGRPFALENIKFFTAVISHYLSDAHVPFHAVTNYDGQLTGQHGLHARFESEMVERYEQELRIRPRPTVIDRSARDFTFDTLITSAGLVPPILEADREAIGTGDAYDDAYFRKLFARTRPLMEQRLSESAAAVAALVSKAWIEAGKPVMPANTPPRPVRRKRSPAGATSGTSDK